MHAFNQRILAEDLVRVRRPDDRERYAAAQRQARIDPNPHQIDAVIFALRRLREGGCILADEVGLGKTIEAGLVIAQSRAEGAQRILLIVPKSLIGQWQNELLNLFGIQARENETRLLRFRRMMYFFFNRPSPSTESDHGFSRRQACAHFAFSSSLSPSILYCFSRSSRIMRFKSSRLVHGISPFRTLPIAGSYPRRQRSMNSTQLIFRPLTLAQLVASAIIELRQSTTVPNVSKTHAFTLANSGFII